MNRSIRIVILLCVAFTAPAPRALALRAPELSGGLVYRDSSPQGPLSRVRCSDPEWSTDPDGYGAGGTQSLNEMWIDAGGLPVGIDAAAVEDAVRRAVATWTEERNDCGLPDRSSAALRVAGTRIGPPVPMDDGLNTVSFSDGICAHTSHVACTQWYPDPATGRPLGWDVVLDTSYVWGTGAGPWLDIENTAVHELGHVLGLGHPSGAVPACTQEHALLTMYPCTWPGDTVKRRLGLGDALGVEELSGAP